MYGRRYRESTREQSITDPYCSPRSTLSSIFRLSFPPLFPPSLQPPSVHSIVSPSPLRPPFLLPSSSASLSAVFSPPTSTIFATVFFYVDPSPGDRLRLRAKIVRVSTRVRDSFRPRVVARFTGWFNWGPCQTQFRGQKFELRILEHSFLSFCTIGN